MGTDELDVDGLEPVGNGDDQPIVINLDVEHHAIVADEAGVGVAAPDVLRRRPSGMPGFVVPSLEGLLGIRVAFPETPQGADGDNSHSGNLVPFWDYCKRAVTGCEEARG